MKSSLKKIHLPTAGKRASLGMALDDHLVSYVEVTATPGGISITRFGEVALETDSGEHEERAMELAKILATLRARSRTKSLQVALPDGTATFFEMVLPESDPFLLEHMVEREVKKALGQSHDFILQTEILYREKDNTKVAVTMMPQEPIERIKSLALKTSFDLEYVGLSTEVVAEHMGHNESASIIISIRSFETSISILSKGSLVIEETVPTGVDIWAATVAEGMEIKHSIAEDAIFFEGFSPTGKDGINLYIRGELRKIAQAAEKLFLYWHVDCRKAKECRVGEVTLTGKGASVPGVLGYLEDALNIEVRTPEPFKGLKLLNEIPEMTEAESLRHLPALSLALRGLKR